MQAQTPYKEAPAGWQVQITDLLAVRCTNHSTTVNKYNKSFHVSKRFSFLKDNVELKVK